MKRIWETPKIENEYVVVNTEEFDQLLDEWAETVYRHLCQLSEDHALVPETLLKRTGTDG